MNINESDPERGIAWARGGLIFGVLASVAGNVANVCLTDSDVHVALRIPGAVIWPLALFGGIEVMVRNRQHRSKLAYLGRGLLMLVSVTTFLTSFVNLNGFMSKTDEPWLARITGPIGIDAMMLGCTVFLLAATLKTIPAPALIAPVYQYAKPIGPRRPLTYATQADVWTMEDALNWSAPKSEQPVKPERARREQPVDGAQEQALKLLMEGVKVSEVVTLTALSRPTTQRIKNALSAIAQDRQADVSAQKLRPALVSMIREAVTR